MAEPRGKELRVAVVRDCRLERASDSITDRLVSSCSRQRAVASQRRKVVPGGDATVDGQRCRRKDRRDNQSTGRPTSNQQQRDCPSRVPKQDIEAETRVRKKSEHAQRRKPAQIHARKWQPARTCPSELYGEPDAEQQRERAMRFVFDEPPDERPNDVVEASELRRANVEMHD